MGSVLTADLLVELYVEQGLSCSAVGARLGVSGAAVHLALVRHGIPTRPQGRRPAETSRLNDDGWLRRVHLDKGWSTNRIARELGVAHATVRRRLEALGIHQPAASGLPTVDAEWVRRRHHVDGMSAATIAAEAGISEHRLRRFMKSVGIDLLGRAERAALTPLADRGWLHARYVEDGLTMAQVAQRAGVSSSTVARWLHRHGIAVRGPGPPPPSLREG